MTKLLLAFERRVTSAIWTLACLLLALAACLGFYQVLTRFIFNEPSTWTEVSIRMILIWMVMLGTVVAFRQGALVSVDLMYRLSRGLWYRLSRGLWLKTLRLIITGISVVFLGVLVWYGAEVAWRVRFQELAGLEPLSIGWASVDRLGLPGIAGWRGAEHSRRSGESSRSTPHGTGYRSLEPTDSPRRKRPMSAAMFVSMIVCFALSVSIAVSIGFSSVVGIHLFGTAPLLVVPKEIFSSIDKFPLAAIPFFILAGNLMEVGGISRRLVDFAKSIVGGLQGGLAITCVLTCMIFAAVSGSSVATTFAIGAILIPAMVKHGYPVPFATVSGSFRHRFAGDRGGTGDDHSAVDPVDSLRRFGRSVDW